MIQLEKDVNRYMVNMKEYKSPKFLAGLFCGKFIRHTILDEIEIPHDRSLEFENFCRDCGMELFQFRKEL
jgi:hypothetical protein